MSDQTAMEDRWQRLSTRIQSHNAKGSALMELETQPDLEVVVAPGSFDKDNILDEGEEEDDVTSEGGVGEDLDGPEDEVDDEDEVTEDPERMLLMMPSYLTMRTSPSLA